MENEWLDSKLATTKLGLNELELSDLRENGLLKPGIHWKSDPNGQIKPWNPMVLYNVNLCRKRINEACIDNEYEVA